MEVGRKRLRTDVDDRSRQQKYLVTSRLVEQNDKILMQKVYGKYPFYFTRFITLIMLFNIEKTLNLISINPYIYQTSDVNKSIRRVVILSLNTLYYRVIEDRVEILSFFANRQNPKKRKLT